MNTVSSIFDTLYFLEAEHFYLLEIKRNDLAEDAPVEQRFKWLRIDKQTDLITELTFSSMDSSEEIEERFFEQGFLKFSAISGTFIEKYNSAQYPLENISSNALPTDIHDMVRDYL
jgi:hypothetical protein